MTKILITGGHPTPAMAIIEALLKRRDVEIVFVGRKYVFDTEKTLSYEYNYAREQKLKFVNLNAGRLTRLWSVASLLSLLKIPLGFFNSIQIILKFRPKLILSFGGYIALPICLVAYLFKIPVFTHEQTMRPGLTTKIIANFSKKIFVSFSETARYFDRKKVIVTGNPLRSDIFKVIDKPFEIIKDRPVIYVTGGSLGSHNLNVIIEKNLESLLSGYIVVHQTGTSAKYQDFERLSTLNHKNYFVARHIKSRELGAVYSLCDMLISRSGANTVSELLALGKPAVLVPLPWSAGNEQRAQAQFLKNSGVAEIFEEKDDMQEFLPHVTKILDNLNTYKAGFKNLNEYVGHDATTKILSHILA